MSAATESLANSVSAGILNSEDPETVRDGAPAYLLLIDGLLQNDPDNKGLLRAAATLNSAYASGFVEDVERRRRMASRALQFAIRAMCRIDRRMCEPRTVTYEDFSIWLTGLERKHVPGVYSLGTAWLGWIQANAEDFNAVADVARVKGIMTRVVELDESYDFGGAHLYLGGLETFLPPAMGGRPEIGRRHFERAIELSDGRNLMAKVIFAEKYARLVFDRELHDALLT
ncbi:MAG: TRAP transporter TatT component family protein, partial [Gammaproteobacteria bacterium]|nr:TRAP transporter TatT component family protein [Gammaproteobacteria bacterium]